MIVSTDADIALEEAKIAVGVAISALSKIVVEQCAGYDEFRDEYSETLEKSLIDLLMIRKFLH